MIGLHEVLLGFAATLLLGCSPSTSPSASLPAVTNLGIDGQLLGLETKSYADMAVLSDTTIALAYGTNDLRGTAIDIVDVTKSSVTDVITLMGHYTSVAMTLAFYDVPDGATGMAR